MVTAALVVGGSLLVVVAFLLLVVVPRARRAAERREAERVEADGMFDRQQWERRADAIQRAVAPPELVAFEAHDPDNADTIWSDGDQLLLRFDMPTDRGRNAGGKAFADNLLVFSDELGVDYSAAWSDASTLRVVALAEHPNFVGYDADGAVSAGMARCRWGDAARADGFGCIGGRQVCPFGGGRGGVVAVREFIFLGSV